jgi:hypothetical protein
MLSNPEDSDVMRYLISSLLTCIQYPSRAELTSDTKLVMP